MGTTPSARTAFTRHQLNFGATQLPFPILIEVTRVERLFKIHIYLYGFANLWRDDVIESAHLALMSGISVRENSRFRKPWKIVDWYWKTRSPPEISTSKTQALLRPLSPICYGNDQHNPASPASALNIGLSALYGLFWWSHIDITCFHPLTKGFEEKQVSSKPKGIGGRLQKHSRRKDGVGNKLIEGERTPITVGDLHDWQWYALVLMERTRIGGHRSFGFGKYVLY